MSSRDFLARPWRWLGGGLLSALALAQFAGCAATVHENHYFAAFKETAPNVREPVQFYRLTVDGNAQFANTRYLTGYFDERAVSLFFNEMRSSTSSSTKLFDDNMKLPGADAGTRITPLSPAAGEGAFVLIMSTNADAIAGTIGAFAESQVVADSLTRMLNRDRFLAKAQSDARLSVQKAEATALVTQVEAHARAAKDAPTGAQAAADYRRALTALAQSLGYAGPEFATLAAARSWFTLDASRAGGTP
jgi:hypothetical protein